MSKALLRLAQAHGIALAYTDVWGAEHRVPERTLRALLAAMGVAAESDNAAQRSYAAHQRERWRRVLVPVAVVRQERVPAIRVQLPQRLDIADLEWLVTEESGVKRSGSIAVSKMAELARATIDGETFIAHALTLDVDFPTGYHALSLRSRGKSLGGATLIVAPAACYSPQTLATGWKAWGIAAQLYALRSARNWGIGDFGDLSLLIEQCAEHGAGVIGVNPLHALFPHNPHHASPYSPSSRLFLNTIYLDVEAIAEFAECGEAKRTANADAFQRTLSELRGAELVDYAAVAEAKSRVLSLLYRHFRSRHLEIGSRRARAFRAFQEERGAALRRHALFEALQEHFFGEDRSIWGTPAWPEAYRHPEAEAVRRFAGEHLERVEYFEYLQWQADDQLSAIAGKVAHLGLGIGLYVDLAVSIDPAGAEAWSHQDAYAAGASVGAPPDEFNMRGQNWGLPPLVPERLRETAYAPFIATLRANMRHAGALRVDHVLGLNRLYWIPSGAEAADGAYVHYPIDDLLGILALESQRHRCMVIGEDLGTVPEELRGVLAASGVLSYRVLLFERDSAGEFKPPARYPAQAIVAASTHDLPTLAGWWEGRDIAVRAELGLFPKAETHSEQSAIRAGDRIRLLHALEREGLLPAGVRKDAASVPAMTPALARAIQTFLARTPCQVQAVQLEDVLGVREQVNMPATVDEHPNWRRRLPLALERLPEDSRFAELAEQLGELRGRAPRSADTRRMT